MPTRLTSAHVLDLERCRMQPVAQLLEERLGRAVQTRLVDQGTIARIARPGLVKLRTRGPVLHRHVLLTDSLAPHLPIAVAWGLIVVKRLPKKVQRELAEGGEPLDRLLTMHGIVWAAELIRRDTIGHKVEQASHRFPWAANGTPLTEMARLLTINGDPQAVLIDEIPLLPELTADEPLTAIGEEHANRPPQPPQPETHP
jgi:chorismate-pyruvate lyase